MYIKKIELVDFRNVQQEMIELVPGLNLLAGENAQGKTSFLEAIHYLASGSSFRSNRDGEIIRFGQPGFTIRAEYGTEETGHLIEAVYSHEKGKQIRIDRKAKFLPALRIRSVVFVPEDLTLVKGSPVRRRQFIDQVLVQISPEYQTHLNNFEKILRRRNAVLRMDNPSSAMLEAMDRVYTETAAHVMLARVNFVKTMDEIAAEAHRQAGGDEEKLNVRYAVSVPVHSPKIDHETLNQALAEQMAQNRHKEREKRQCLFGPHRDDLNIYLNGKPAKAYASQGQQRNIIVALKLAQVEALHRILDAYPILLLDEVLAELDGKRRLILLDYLGTAAFQTFLATVEISQLGSINGRMITVTKGQFTV
ncbi:MAG: DNA replication/repair protein RecF [Solirubrobacterales bacterium]